MHLNECFAAAFMAFSSASSYNETSETFPSYLPSPGLSECFASWGFKRTTAFYQSSDLILPWYFGALCFSFSIGGVVMMLIKPKWTRKSRFPYTLFSILLLFVQGPLSFLADYQNMTEDSISHVLDRFLACPLVCFELAKILTMYPHICPMTFTCYAASFICAIFSFLKSQVAQSEEDCEGFIFWHNCWHLYPLVASTLMLCDRYRFGEYDAAISYPSRKKGSHKATMLLSDVAMRNTPISGPPRIDKNPSKVLNPNIGLRLRNAKR